MSFTKTFLTGAAFGAAAMYLLDPVNGDTRRNQARRKAEETLDSPAGQRAVGSVIDVTRPLHDRGPDSDPGLADKVRSEVLGRNEFSHLSINLDAVDGVVTLRGTVEESTTRQQLVEAVQHVGGVARVEDLLHAQGQTPANMMNN